MKILKTQTHVDNLNQLRRRKTELKALLDAEQAELRADWQELRVELQPKQLVAKFAQSLLGPVEQTGAGAAGMAAVLQGPLRMAADLLVGNARAKLLLNIVTPLLLTYLPRLTRKAKGITLKNSKAKMYGTLRKGIAGLRGQLKRKKAEVPDESETVDIIQPS